MGRKQRVEGTPGGAVSSVSPKGKPRPRERARGERWLASVMHDVSIAELAWFFRDSARECEAVFILGALDMTGDLEKIASGRFDVDAITKHRLLHARLAKLEMPHADVLGWMFEERRWHATVASLFDWPGVAVRTVAARFALAIAGSQSRIVSSRAPTQRRPGLRPSNAFMNHRGPWTPRQRDESTLRVPTGDFHHRKAGEKYERPRWNALSDERSDEYAPTVDGMTAFLVGLATSDKARAREVIKAIRDETSERVVRAISAYERAANRHRRPSPASLRGAA